MPINGRENLYKYTYLNANGYLNKFREKLNAPNLSIPMLAALLKEYQKAAKPIGFIVKNRDGKECLYNKEQLNDILGIYSDGYTHTKPEHNFAIQYLEKTLNRWESQAIEREHKKELQYDISTYQSDDEDMQKVSDKLIHNDSFEEIKETMKKPRSIYITESQYKDLKKKLLESYFVEPAKVKLVQKFLDDNFVKGALPSIGEDGYAKPLWIVAMKVPFSDKPKNMTATQAFYLLQDKFNKIYSDPKQRDSFLKKVLVDWYNGKISKFGLLSKNNY